jgi:parallel beta-helix repeat protein
MSWALPLPGGADAGDLVVVQVALDGAKTVTAVSDDASPTNSWHLGPTATNASVVGWSLVWSVLTVSLTTSNHLKLSWSGSATAKAASLTEFAGVSAVSAVDLTHTNSGTGSPYDSGATGSLATFGELVMGGWAVNANAGSAYLTANDPGYTTISQASTSMLTNTITGEWAFTSATSPVQLRPTSGVSGSTKWAGGGMAFLPDSTRVKGSTVLEGFVQQGTSGTWVHSGDVLSVPPPKQTEGCAGSKYMDEECDYPDWVYEDDEFLATRKLPSGGGCQAAEVLGSGNFCVDNTHNAVMLGFDPGSHVIEYADEQQFVDGTANDAVGVTIHQLSYQQFASTSATMRIENGWLVDDVTGNENHACGIGVHDGSESNPDVVQNSAFDSNGQYGMCGGHADHAVYSSDEASFNNQVAFDSGHSAGLKINAGVEVLVQDSVVSDNSAHGIWTDVDSQGITIQNNTAEGNTVIYGGGDGIRIEISCAVGATHPNVVDGNLVEGNEATGVDVHNSGDTIVSDNTVVVPESFSGYGIRIVGSDRSMEGETCSYNDLPDVENNLIQDNTITLNDPSQANGVVQQGTVEILTNNTFTGNDYLMHGISNACTTSTRWKWWNGTVQQSLTWPQWQALPEDATGTCTSPTWTG